MSDVAEKLTRRRQLRNAALILIPAVLLAACAPAPAPPPPPPPPAPVYTPAPPPPPPPVVRG
jgi:multidrug efflux pump subunit AcrA (membrane-fusion protein)